MIECRQLNLYFPSGNASYWQLSVDGGRPCALEMDDETRKIVADGQDKTVSQNAAC